MDKAFTWGWWSFDLGTYRRCDGTYALYPYSSLPPLDEGLFRGDFAWLAPGRPRRPPRRPPPLFARAAALGLTLPPALERFMTTPELQGAVPSCTACEWDLSEAPQPCRVTPGAYTIRFLRDQQDCLFWYLHVRPDGTAPVLCSPIPFDDPELEVSREVVIENSWIVAPHFEHFVYRFWIENELWDALDDSDPALTPAQQAYVAHYAAAQQAAKEAAKKKAAAKKTAKKTAAKKAAKKTAAKTTAKTTAAKTTAKKTAAKKTAKKTVAKKTAKKTAAKTTAAKTTAKKTTAKKTAKKPPQRNPRRSRSRPRVAIR